MSAKDNANLLDSWKEISEYLKKDRRTLLEWEENGLPIRRYSPDSPKSRVYAYTDEIDRWLQDRQAKKKKIFVFEKLKKNKLLYLLFALPFLFSLVLFVKVNNSNNPYDYRIFNSRLVIINEKGNVLWRYDTQIKNLVDEGTYRTHFQYKKNNFSGKNKRDFPHLIIKDIDDDKKNEVLFSIQTQDEWNEGTLFCFDYKGNLKWHYKVGREIKFGSKTYSGNFRIDGFDLCDFDGNGSFEIIVNSRHKLYYPSQLAILNNEGYLLGEYWNSGYLTDYAFVDLDSDGYKEIIYGGINNEYKKACLIVFDARNISGCSPQGDSYRCEGLKQGSEKYYILFPRTDVDQVYTIHNVLNKVDVLGNKRISVVPDFSKIYYELNFNMQLEEIRLSDHFEMTHRKALQEGKIGSIINDEYKRRLKNGILYFNGKNWETKPSQVKIF